MSLIFQCLKLLDSFLNIIFLTFLAFITFLVNQGFELPHFPLKDCDLLSYFFSLHIQ